MMWDKKEQALIMVFFLCQSYVNIHFLKVKQRKGPVRQQGKGMKGVGGLGLGQGRRKLGRENTKNTGSSGGHGISRKNFVI